jgi:NAD(P)-dependent dehydrogenase (short-subunit alcohol dehydrogenase family)
MEEPQISFPDFRLDGRKALVTGAGKGIGRALALGLANAGATVALTGRDMEALQRVAREAEALGTRTHQVMKLDVRETGGLEGRVEECARVMGGLQILVNNAGYEHVCDSLELTPEIWDDIVDTNLKGAFFCARAAAKVMAEGAGGAILNVCSLTSSVGVPTAVPYTSSKTGLLGMTRALAVEWASQSIRVNAIAPGYFHTAMTDPFFQNGDWRERMLAGIPLGRFGHVQDLIGTTLLLCSSAGEYITGQMFNIDGGYLASI